jgi:hypothetical protein
LPRDEAMVLYHRSRGVWNATSTDTLCTCRDFSGEDAEKSSTATDQGVDHRSRKSG